MDYEEQEAAHLERFGLFPAPDQLSAVRAILREQVLRERASQGEGNTLLMRLCCFQLFCIAEPSDVLLIWEAKQASFDAGCSIDIQLLCGAGLESARAFLRDASLQRLSNNVRAQQEGSADAPRSHDR